MNSQPLSKSILVFSSIYCLNIFSFSPIMLILHCTFIFLFKKWIGPVGTFYSSLIVFTTVLLLNINELYILLCYGNYYYVDFGRWFFCLDHSKLCVAFFFLWSHFGSTLLSFFFVSFWVVYHNQYLILKRVFEKSHKSICLEQLNIE